MATNHGNAATDFLDMSKPLNNFMLHSTTKVEILPNGLDTLNDNFITTEVDPGRLLSTVLMGGDKFLHQDKDAQDNFFSENQEKMASYHNLTRVMNTERDLTRKGPRDLDIASPSSSNESGDLTTTKSQTAGSESGKGSHFDSSASSRMFSESDSERSSSPESYNLLYQSFKLAAENQISIYENSESVRPHLELTTPKLERLKQVHQQKGGDLQQPSINSDRQIKHSRKQQGAHANNTSDSHGNEKTPNLHSEDADVKEKLADSSEASSNSCTSSPLDNKKLPAERKITFADLAQNKKSSPPPCPNEGTTLSLPDLTSTTHWTEMISATGHSKPPGELELKVDGEVSPRRPLSLPIQLRHVTKPSGKPFPKEITSLSTWERSEKMGKQLDKEALEKRWPRLELAGVAGLTNIPPQTEVDSLPPSLHQVSPRKEGDSISVDLSQKKGLVASIIAAVDEIILHFGRTRDPAEKKKLGDSRITPEIGHLILAKLCPSVSALLLDGLQPYTRSFIVGRVRTSLWAVVEAMTQPGPTTKAACDLKREVEALASLTDSTMKFNAFVFGLLNAKILEHWLLHLNSREEILARLYKPGAFLQLSTAELSGLFEELMVAIQPLTLLPFNLDLRFQHNRKYMKTKEEQQPTLASTQLTLPSKNDQTRKSKHRNHSYNEAKPNAEQNLPPASLASLPQPLSSLTSISPQSTVSDTSGQQASMQSSGGTGWSTGWSFNWMSSLALRPEGEEVNGGSDPGGVRDQVPATKRAPSASGMESGNWRRLGQSLVGAFDKIMDKSMASAAIGRTSNRSLVEREMTVFKKSSQPQSAVTTTAETTVVPKPPPLVKMVQPKLKRAPPSISLDEKR